MTTFATLGFAEPIASWAHLLGAGAALFGALSLVRAGRGALHRTALAVFAASVVLLLGVSGSYHLLAPGTAARAALRHVDHAAIWILIAGTFTPVHVLLLRGFWRWGMLGLIWGGAVVALVLEVIWLEAIPHWLAVTLYLALGWMGALSCIRVARERGGASVRPVLWGGVAYSVGATIEAVGQPVLVPGVVGPHELFHLAVLVGIACHWRFVRAAAAGLPREAPQPRPVGIAAGAADAIGSRSG